MNTDKTPRMTIPKSAKPGIEVDAHGEPIPISQRTSENRAKAVGGAAVERAADELPDEA